MTTTQRGWLVAPCILAGCAVMVLGAGPASKGAKKAPGAATATKRAKPAPAKAPRQAASKPKQKPRRAETWAHVLLSGVYPDVQQQLALFGRPRPTVRQVVDRIAKAKADRTIRALVVEIRGPQVGWGKREELRRALTDFRASGKKVYALLQMAGAGDYMVACAADEICIVPAGWLFLTGLRAEVTFFKGLLDLIGVQADMIQMGKYKGAAEPFMRKAMSPALRKQFDLMLDDFYSQLVGIIAKGRRRPPAEIKRLIDQGPFTAADAIKHRLVDRLAYPSEYTKVLGKELGVRVTLKTDYGAGKGAMDEGFAAWMQMMQLMLNPPKQKFRTGVPKVAIITCSGMIVPGKSRQDMMAGGLVGSDTLVKAIRKARFEKEVVGVVLRVNSPGGSAVASDLIWRELSETRKPVVASMADVAASGGYYVAMGARKILAGPGTLTGSIGVVGGKFVLRGLYNKIGLSNEVLTRGANANIFSSTEPFSPGERAAILRLMKDVYDQFVTKAAKARGKTYAQIDAVAQGRVWTGQQALKRGLVDQLGGLPDAIALAKKMAGLKPTDKCDLVFLPEPKSPFEEMLAPFGGVRVSAVLSELLADQRSLLGLWHLRHQHVFAVMPYALLIR